MIEYWYIPRWNEVFWSLELFLHIITQTDPKYSASPFEKLPLVLFGFAMEILAIKYYDLIEKQLDFAYLIDSLANKNQYLEMMIKLTAKINSERMNKILGKTSFLFRF